MRSVRFVIVGMTLALLLLPFLFLGIAVVYERVLVSSDLDRLREVAGRAAKTDAREWAVLASRERLWLRAFDADGAPTFESGTAIGSAFEDVLGLFGAASPVEPLLGIDAQLAPVNQRPEVVAAIDGRPEGNAQPSASGQTVVVSWAPEFLSIGQAPDVWFVIAECCAQLRFNPRVGIARAGTGRVRTSAFNIALGGSKTHEPIVANSGAQPTPGGGVLLLSAGNHRGVRQLLLARNQLAKLIVYQAVFALLFAVALGRYLVRPLERLAEGARRFPQESLADLKLLERRDELGQLARVFNALTKNLEARREGTVRLAADIAHELKNPLATAVRSRLQRLREHVGVEQKSRVQGATGLPGLRSRSDAAWRAVKIPALPRAFRNDLSARLNSPPLGLRRRNSGSETTTATKRPRRVRPTVLPRSISRTN